MKIVLTPLLTGILEEQHIVIYPIKKIDGNPLAYKYFDSFDYEKMKTIPYSFQQDSEKFIKHCINNKKHLSQVLAYILEQKGYL